MLSPCCVLAAEKVKTNTKCIINHKNSSNHTTTTLTTTSKSNCSAVCGNICIASARQQHFEQSATCCQGSHSCSSSFVDIYCLRVSCHKCRKGKHASKSHINVNATATTTTRREHKLQLQSQIELQPNAINSSRLHRHRGREGESTEPP